MNPWRRGEEVMAEIDAPPVESINRLPPFLESADAIFVRNDVQRRFVPDHRQRPMDYDAIIEVIGAAPESDLDPKEIDGETRAASEGTDAAESMRRACGLSGCPPACQPRASRRTAIAAAITITACSTRPCGKSRTFSHEWTKGPGRNIPAISKPSAKPRSTASGDLMRAAGASQGAGIYLIEPRAWDLTANGARLDMAQMIERLLASKAQIVSFPVRDIRLRPPSSEVERPRPDNSKAARLAAAGPAGGCVTADHRLAVWVRSSQLGGHVCPLRVCPGRG